MLVDVIDIVIHQRQGRARWGGRPPLEFENNDVICSLLVSYYILCTNINLGAADVKFISFALPRKLFWRPSWQNCSHIEHGEIHGMQYVSNYFAWELDCMKKNSNVLVYFLWKNWRSSRNTLGTFWSSLKPPALLLSIWNFMKNDCDAKYSTRTWPNWPENICSYRAPQPFTISRWTFWRPPRHPALA